MKQATWRVGLYSKVVLTIIAVSLMGLLVRQLPGKVEAKPERYGKVRVDVVKLSIFDLETDLVLKLGRDKKLEKQGKMPFLDRKGRVRIAQMLDSEFTMARREIFYFEELLQKVLEYRYAMGYRVKFMNNDFIILEAE